MHLSGYIGKSQNKWLAATQKRLLATESLLGSIKSAKMMGLTTRLKKVIRDLRNDEIKASFDFRNLIVGSIVLC
jgi:ATP-binding cassette subfamily C (CFTR/MRP) protein 1